MSFQVLGKGLLNQPVLAVDVGVGHSRRYESRLRNFCTRSNALRGTNLCFQRFREACSRRSSCSRDREHAIKREHDGLPVAPLPRPLVEEGHSEGLFELGGAEIPGWQKSFGG
jgi:hypothetical protein